MLGTVSFAAPWALAALVALPVIWWLLRVNPPAPRRIVFPAVRLLLGLNQTEETPVHTPPWLLILRLLIAALVILGVAHPLLNAGEKPHGDGPLVLVLDDGWAAATRWTERLDLAESRIEQARRDGRGVLLATTAPVAAAAGSTTNFADYGLLAASDALAKLRAIEPKPWPVDRLGFVRAFEASLPPTTDTEVVWLSDGLFDANPAATAEFAERLSAIGHVTAHVDPPARRAKTLLPPESTASALTLRASRPAPGVAESIVVRAATKDGRVLARQTLSFDADMVVAEHELELPSDLRNEIARLDIESEASAAAVLLLDERWRRRPVGLISGGSFERSQPLLSDLYYLDRALTPFAEVRRGDIGDLVDGDISVLVLSDVGNVGQEEQGNLEAWVEAGGVLVRFAGPRMAEGVDDLVPVRLRVGGGRVLGGALSWEQPMRLRPFPERSPFAGLIVPDDVLVERQVLAEPSLDLADKAWAHLGDGTPLVTADRLGRGWIVLFHTTANTDWSSLSLSGLFVDMMHRIVALSEGVVGAGSAVRLPALTGLDGFGRLGEPSPHAVPIAGGAFATTIPGPHHPPGEYGNPLQRRALNLGSEALAATAFETVPGVTSVRGYGDEATFDLRPWLLLAAFTLALADTIIALSLRGLLPNLARAGPLLLLVAALTGVEPRTSQAQSWSDNDIAYLVQQTRFAFVRTGDMEVDRISDEGLKGLSSILRNRTAVDAGDPIGVELETDELSFFPLLYWPVTAMQSSLSHIERSRVDSYLRHGGMILFDTRDQSPIDRMGRTDRSGGPLNTILRGLDVPPLLPVPRDHALTRAFYLLERFPGRWTGGDLWVERYEGDVNDGVSSIVIGGNDYAAAWALDELGYPLYPVVPGTNRQREMAYRFGVNLVMYALTGNYKADQVHIPAILRRLGRDEPPVTE